MAAELKRRLLQGGWITGSAGVGWSGGSRYYAVIQAAFTDLDAAAAEHIYDALEVRSFTSSAFVLHNFSARCVYTAQ